MRTDAIINGVCVAMLRAINKMHGFNYTDEDLEALKLMCCHEMFSTDGIEKSDNEHKQQIRIEPARERLWQFSDEGSESDTDGSLSESD